MFLMVVKVATLSNLNGSTFQAVSYEINSFKCMITKQVLCNSNLKWLY